MCSQFRPFGEFLDVLRETKYISRNYHQGAPCEKAASVILGFRLHTLSPEHEYLEAAELSPLQALNWKGKRPIDRAYESR